MPALRAAAVIRCDVGPVAGVGHVMRCLALAEGLQERGHQVTFVADLDSVPWARDQVAVRGFRHVEPPASLSEEAAVVARLDPWLVVVDSYLLPAQVYVDLRSSGAVMLALADGDPAWRQGDLVLDQNIGAEGDRWELPSTTRRLAGLEYALMRDDVRTLRPDRLRTETHAVAEVFAVFGGADAAGAAPEVTRALAATGQPFRATVVAARPELADALARIPLRQRQELEITGRVSDLPRRVVAADLVVSAAGSSSWELFCLGAATALVCVADNQMQAYRRVVHGGLGGGLGLLEDLRRDAGPAIAVLEELLASSDRRAELRTRAWGRVDGRGRERVIDACEGVARHRGVLPAG